MLFSWFTRRRRARLLSQPFPVEWEECLHQNVPLYVRLNGAERAQLRDDLRVMVAEKNWEGCGGLEMTDEIKVTIAAHAALLLLGIKHDYFARVMSILVYPTGFRSPDGWSCSSGIVDLDVGASGQAWYDGPVVLAWDDVLQGGQNPRDGLNVVLHEFAHQLDYLDGVIDGTPPLRRKGDYAKWQEVMTREYERLRREAEQGTPLVLDQYGATDHAEFFAVATEAFFEKPRQMCARHPELYAVLGEYYGQDPAAREQSELARSEVERRKPRRASRVAARAEPHARVAAEWPGWVRFWEIHPGVSRAQALLPLDHHVILAVISLIISVASFALGSHDHGKINGGMIVGPPFFLAAIVFAIWLRLAVRWVDRFGAWGGDFRSPEPSSSSESEAPPG